VINSFKSFLVEEEKSVYFTFGRMNPPTTGHEKLFNALAAKAGRNPYRIFVSQSQDAKKNPLAYKDKIKAIRKMFPKHARSVMVNNNVKNAMNAASELYKEGYKTLVMVVGSDRVREFSTLLEKYNGQKGRHGFYNFSRINVVSAGDRDPDAEGVEGMSASKMRAAASAGDFTKFSQGVPRNVSNAETKAIYNMVRKGMGLKETKEYAKHVQLEPVSEIRESYVNGKLFNVGDVVAIKETGELAKVKSLGSNYIIVEGSGNVYRKWLDAIEPVEPNKREYSVMESLSEQSTPQDSDIKDRKGSQPAAYHRGLAKSTKTKRDAHFKKHGKKRDDDPSAYKPAPGDKGAKTKPSKYTKAFKDMYGEQTVDQARATISREKEIERRRDAADKKRHDSILDRARTLRTRKINRRTTSA
jgi:hypothetical protein